MKFIVETEKIENSRQTENIEEQYAYRYNCLYKSCGSSMDNFKVSNFK